MKDAPLSIRASSEERALWEKAAGYEPISRWARRNLNKIAKAQVAMQPKDPSLRDYLRRELEEGDE